MNSAHDNDLEIVIAFKTIYINEYSIFLIDAGTKRKTKVSFRLELPHVWELPITGLFINSSFSLSIKLLIIADPAAENIKAIREKRVDLKSGAPLVAITIPVKPVIPTLKIIFGFDNEIIALRYFIC